jgi:hypothetical protein
MNVDISVDNPDFFVFEQQRDSYMIPFMDSASYEVFFTPNAVGVSTANITITTDNPAFPEIVIPITANVTTTAVEPNNATPNLSQILSVSPNPFKDNVSIKCVQHLGKVSEFAIFNVKGEKVYSTTLEGKGQGEQSLVWSGKDYKGLSCPSGIYFCQLSSAGKVLSTQKLLKLK